MLLWIHEKNKKSKKKKKKKPEHKKKKKKKKKLTQNKQTKNSWAGEVGRRLPVLESPVLYEELFCVS